MVHSIARPRIRTAHTLRRVRLWLVMTLVTLGAIAAGHARADVIGPPTPPRPVRVIPYLEGESSYVTVSGPPNHAMFRVVNPRGERITVSIESITLLGGGNVRLGITGVQANDSPANASAISVPAHGAVRLTVFYAGVPAARLRDQRFVIRLAARVAGTVLRADSVVSRATRHPWHHGE